MDQEELRRTIAELEALQRELITMLNRLTGLLVESRAWSPTPPDHEPQEYQP